MLHLCPLEEPACSLTSDFSISQTDRVRRLLSPGPARRVHWRGPGPRAHLTPVPVLSTAGPPPHTSVSGLPLPVLLLTARGSCGVHLYAVTVC